jgi:NAD(P)H-hydrate repair Nnr-like enzyme with NAD(P)H-hydrate dehydratase domain
VPDRPALFGEGSSGHDDGLPEDDVGGRSGTRLARILDHEHDAIVLGPGLRPGLATTELVRELLGAGDEEAPAPIVLDAEALRSMATLGEWQAAATRPAVLTPHPGEFARLRAGTGADPEADGDLAADDLRPPATRPPLASGRRPEGAEP